MKRKWTPEEVREWYDGHTPYIYRNPEDGNWIVRKARGLGRTMNLANPRTWLFLAGVLAVILAIIAWSRPSDTIAVIGGADGPTAIFITRKP